MITTVYIIRHGLTAAAAEKRYAGHLDVPLSPEGEKQMERLARHLIGKTGPGLSEGADSALEYVYCSDLQRARKSAEIIARPFGLQPVEVSALRERNFGSWEGMTFDEVNQVFPGEFQEWVTDPLAFCPVGGESAIDVRNRVMRVFYNIIAKKRGQKIAVVAHGGVNRIILCELLGIPLRNLFKIEQDFSALNVCLFHDKTPVLTLMNHVVEMEAP
ncbi:MAG: histidine phosphatase family protein [Thermodesulfobacteriota bacterium]